MIFAAGLGAFSVLAGLRGAGLPPLMAFKATAAGLLTAEGSLFLNVGNDDAGGLEFTSSAVNLARTVTIGSTSRVVVNVGPSAGQTVFHLHFHLLGGRPLSWPPG